MGLTWIYLETCGSPSEFASFVLFNEKDRESQKGVLHLAETPQSRIAGEVIGTARTCSQKANPGPPEVGFEEISPKPVSRESAEPLEARQQGFQSSTVSRYLVRTLLR
jgi:hypothetical protein